MIYGKNKLIRENHLNNQHFHLVRITQSQVLLKVFEKIYVKRETVHFYVTFRYSAPIREFLGAILINLLGNNLFFCILSEATTESWKKVS